MIVFSRDTSKDNNPGHCGGMIFLFLLFGFAISREPGSKEGKKGSDIRIGWRSLCE